MIFMCCEFVCFCLLFGLFLVWRVLFFVPFGIVVSVFVSLYAFCVFFAPVVCVRFWFCLLLFVSFFMCLHCLRALFVFYVSDMRFSLVFL